MFYTVKEVRTMANYTVVDARQLAEILQVSVRVIYRETNAGRIPYINIGDRRRYVLEQVLGMIPHESAPEAPGDAQTVE